MAKTDLIITFLEQLSKSNNVKFFLTNRKFIYAKLVIKYLIFRHLRISLRGSTTMIDGLWSC